VTFVPGMSASKALSILVIALAVLLAVVSISAESDSEGLAASVRANLRNFEYKPAGMCLTSAVATVVPYYCGNAAVCSASQPVCSWWVAQ